MNIIKIKAFLSSKPFLLIAAGLSISIILNLFIIYPNSTILRILAFGILVIFLLAPFILTSFLKKMASTCIGFAAGGSIVPNFLIENGFIASKSHVFSLGKLSISYPEASNGLFVIAAICIILEYLNEIELIKLPTEKKTEKIVAIIKNSTFKTHYGEHKGFEGIEQFENSLVNVNAIQLTKNSFDEDLDIIYFNYGTMNYLLEEIVDLVESSRSKKAIIKKLKSIRGGSLFELLNSINPYLEHQLEPYKNKNGNVSVMIGSDEEKYLKINYLISKILKY